MKTTIFIIFLFSLFSTSASSEFESDLEIENFVKRNFFRSFDALQKQTRIVGGKKTKENRYPYQVALINSFSNDKPFCGGSLISPQWVLTAAHCVGFVTHVQIGRYDFSDDTESYELIKVDFELVHPKFKASTMDYDYMLLKLDTPSSYAPVLLDDGSDDLSRGQDLTVIGWGQTRKISRKLSDILLEVEVDYFDRNKCDRRYRLFSADITERMICASRFGNDSCKGDSGGPLIIKGKNYSADIQVGIVSWGIGCANKIIPGVYSRVSKALDFIDEHVSDHKLGKSTKSAPISSEL